MYMLSCSLYIDLFFTCSHVNIGLISVTDEKFRYLKHMSSVWAGQDMPEIE